MYLSGASEQFNKSTLRLFVLSQYSAKFLPPWATMRIFLLQLCLSSTARGNTSHNPAKQYFIEVETVVALGAHREADVTHVTDMTRSSAQHGLEHRLASPKSSSHQWDAAPP